MGALSLVSNRPTICIVPPTRYPVGFPHWFRLQAEAAISSAESPVHSSPIHTSSGVHKVAGKLVGQSISTSAQWASYQRRTDLVSLVDLSAPPGRSVNDGISPALCSLNYTSVRVATKYLRPGTFMAKLDLKSTYRMVPVHPADHWLLGLNWEGHSYCDKALSFGLRSAPIIFSAVADALASAMLLRGIPILLHYIDDFLFWAPDPLLCCRHLLTAASVCHELGLPAEPLKVEGPATTITFLGIEIDTLKQEIRLPHSKLKHTLALWSRKRVATKRELQVLLGHLNHAATVVPAGKPFLRHIIEIMSPLKQADHLNIQCRSDLAWWYCFVESWNGVNFFHSLLSGPSIVADASGSWGCGAYSKQSLQWFQIPWPTEWSDTNIAIKELFPVADLEIFVGGFYKLNPPMSHPLFCY